MLNNICVSCLPGTTNAAGDLASESNTECSSTVCEENQYVSSHSCLSCPAGSTNDSGGDLASGSDTSCIATQCPSNQKVVSNSCVECSPGKNILGYLDRFFFLLNL